MARRRTQTKVPTFWMGLFCGLLLAHGQEIDPASLYSTNCDRLPQFWRAIEQSNGPVTVLAFGDSVSASYRSTQTYVYERLERNFGSAGTAIHNSSSAQWQLGNGAYMTGPSTNWWTAYGVLPPGSHLFWKNLLSPDGSLPCDKVGVFWVAHPQGGSFTLSVATNGGPWSGPLLTLDGHSATPQGRHASVSLPRQGYSIRVDAQSGTNYIVGPDYLDGASTGVRTSFMAQDGASLWGLFMVSTNVLYPILRALNPQLTIVHMKELPDIDATYYSNRLYDLEKLWQGGITNGDVVYLGTPYEYRDTQGLLTPLQNSINREAALRDGRAYVDGMNPCVSYQSMVTNQFLSDSAHPSHKCHGFLADIVWRQLGFYALRAERRLAAEPQPGGLRLSWSTATNLNYRVESSPNLANWSSEYFAPGDGTVHTFAKSGSTNLFFRLALSPGF
jgi:hypothetical protein